MFAILRAVSAHIASEKAEASSINMKINAPQELPKIEIPLFLDDEHKKNIEMNFGVDVSPQIEPNPNPPDSPTTSLYKAADYLVKLNKKGYPVLVDQKPEQIKKAFIKSMNPPNKFKSYRRSAEDDAVKQIRYNDPKLQFFLNSQVLNKSRKKIQALPFKNKDDQSLILDKLEDKIVEIAHYMNHMNMFDPKKKKYNQLQQSTKQFVMDARKAEHEVISMAFKDNLIDKNMVSNEIKDEFREFFPIKSPERRNQQKYQIFTTKNKNDDIMNRMFDPARKGIKLPPTYRPDIQELKQSTRPGTALNMKKEFTKIAQSVHNLLARPQTAPVAPTENVNEETQKKKERKTPEILATEIKHPEPIPLTLTHRTKGSKKPVRPRSINKSLPRIKFEHSYTDYSTVPSLSKSTQRIIVKSKKRSNEKIDSIFWNIGDPLAKSREGNYVDQLATMRDIPREFEFVENEFSDDEEYHPFEFLSKNEPENKTNNTEEEKNINNSKEENKENQDNAKTDQLGSEKLPGVNNDKYSFVRRLLNDNLPVGTYETSQEKQELIEYLQSRTSEVFETDISQSDVYQRLEKIWEELGFSISQKLDMALKYSDTSESNARLSEAITPWEQAFSNIMRYQETYKKLKSFLISDYIITPNEQISQVYLSLEKDMMSAIANVETSENLLRTSLGDELILKHRKIRDIISSRDTKLKILLKQTGISIEDIFE